MLGGVKHANLIFLQRGQLGTSQMLPDMLTKFVFNREIMRSLGGMEFSLQLVVGFVFRLGEHELRLTA